MLFSQQTFLNSMLFSWLVVIGILISITVFLSSDVSAQEQTNVSSNNVINVMNTHFSIQYNNTGIAKILSAKPDVQAKALVITPQATKDGLLTITLPRELIDKKDRGADSPFFFVISGYISGDAKENSKTLRNSANLTRYGPCSKLRRELYIDTYCNYSLK